LTYPGNISGTLPLIQGGSGTTILTSTNYSGYSGTLTVTNGTLSISGFTAPGTTNSIGAAGILVSDTGTLVVGGSGSVSTLEMSGFLTVNGGTLVASINTSTSPSNTVYSLINNGFVNSGKLKLVNGGPLPTVGQKFTIFTTPLLGGSTMSIVSPGFTVQNNLETDGSVTVTAVQPAPTITTTVSGGNLNLSWPSSWTGGVHVQVQTNSLSTGLSTNWFTIPGTDASNVYSAPINSTNGAVFYRLIAP